MEGKKLAVTGAIASGKSTVCRILEELGASCVSSDALVASCLDIHHPLSAQILDIVGPQAISENKSALNRKVIAELIFQDDDKRKRLESLLHPWVWREIQKYWQDHPSLRDTYVAEVPLLYEVEWQARFDAVIWVQAPRNLRLERYLKRPGASEDDFVLRERRLISEDVKRNQSHYIVDATQSESFLRKSLSLLLQSIS